MHQTYVNKYKYNEDICKAAAMDVYYRRPFIAAVHMVLAIVCIWGIAITAYFLAGGIDPKYHYSTYIFYAVAPIAVEIAVYVKYRIMLKKEKELLHGESCEMTVRVENDRITEYVGEEAVGDSALFDVEKIYESRDFFLVIALSEEYFVLKKGSFTEGDEANFKNEIKQRVKGIHSAAIEKGKKK